MDLVASCKEKLQYFRIKELKDVLTQLGLSKQGKKQDLVDRILSILSEDQVSKLWIKKNACGKQRVAKLVEDTYRKLQVSGAIDLSSKGQGSDSSNVKIKSEIDDTFQSDTKIRCLCGNVLDTEPLVKCEDTRCHVSQHINCVVIPDKPMDGTPHVPDKFYCEICRVDRADPFCVSVTHLLFPVKLTTTNIPTDGTSPVQSVERTFQLTKANKELVSKPEYDVQVWCMLLNDKVSFRMQWPQYTDLKVNGLPVRAINRPGSQMLGANGRDSGSVITPYSKDGINRISLTVVDARVFCLGVRIIKRLTMPEVLSMIPEEPNGERFEDALARVCCCVGGGNANDNADSDSDLEVVSDTFSINLRCPMSGSRMKIAGRFKPCVHMGCFDLEVFVEMNERSRKWQCPICLKNYSLENIIIDPYFNRITTLMKDCGEEITEVEVKPDGFWRVKVKNESERRELGTLAHWHRPDGSLFVSTDEIKKMEILKLKQEGISDGPIGLKLGIRKNSNGVWEVSKPENTNTSSGNNRLNEDLENHEHVIIPMSSSDTGSGRDEDDPSVNQGGGEHIDYSTTNGIEMCSAFNNNIDSAYGYSVHNASAPIGDAEVIILSDSEEDNDVLCKAQKKLMAFLSEIQNTSPIPSIRRHAENLLLTVAQLLSAQKQQAQQAQLVQVQAQAQAQAQAKAQSQRGPAKVPPPPALVTSSSASALPDRPFSRPGGEVVQDPQSAVALAMAHQLSDRGASHSRMRSQAATKLALARSSSDPKRERSMVKLRTKNSNGDIFQLRSRSIPTGADDQAVAAAATRDRMQRNGGQQHVVVPTAATVAPKIARGITTGSAEAAIKANANGNSPGGFDEIIQDTLQRARLTAASRKSARISYDNVEPLAGLSAQELADQLSLMEADQYFSKLNPRELTNKAWTRENKHREAPHVMALIELFDATAEWVSSEILHPQLQAVERAKMITLFIDAADNCYQMNNFNTLFEITTGLSAPCIRQLGTTWSLVSAAAHEKYQCLQQVCSPDENYRSYRQAFALAEGQPRLACWFILVKDLFTYEEAMKSMEEGLVNWQKFRKIYRVISEALDRQNFNYVPPNSAGANGAGGNGASSTCGISRKGRGILRHDRKTQIHIRHRIDTIRKDSSVLYQLARNANTQESILFVNSLSEAGFL